MVSIAEALTKAAITATVTVLICTAVVTMSPLLIAASCLVTAEALFAVCFAVKLRKLDAVLTNPGPGHDAIALMRKCIARITYSDDYLSSWFDGTPRDHIHKQNLREFMAYGFWFKQYEDLSDHDRQFMETVLKQLEKQTGVVLPEGKNPDIHFLSHLWDSLKVSYKPLTFYICTEMLALFTACLLRLVGFQRHTINGNIFYTYRVVSNSSSGINSSASQDRADDSAPLLFVHGVGAGLLPYVLFVCKLVFTGRPLIMPEYKHISMRYTPHIPTVQECAECVSDFLDQLGVPSVHVMGHSYGTLVCARFAISFADKVSSLALMDPVCFAMYMPRLIRTFLYAKTPDSGSWLLDMALSMVAKELHCAATFCRQFIWNDYNMWPERLPARTLVALSGGDVLCPADDIRQHLEEETAARVIYHPTLHHGAVLLWPSYADMVIKGWQQMLLDPAPVAAAVLAAAASEEVELEPVLLHGTAAAAVATADELHEQQQQREQSDVVSVLLVDQDQAELSRDQQQQQPRLGAKQQQWQQQWQHKWQELQQQDAATAADLLQPSLGKLAAVGTAAVNCSNSSGNGSIKTEKQPLSHTREISECPSYASGDLGVFSGLNELSESSLGSDSPLAESTWGADEADACSSGCSSMQCEQCGSVFTLQHQHSINSSSTSEDSWVEVADAQAADHRLQDQQQRQSKVVSTAAAANGGQSCTREELAAHLCDCCCEQQWQQGVVEATCA